MSLFIFGVEFKYICIDPLGIYTMSSAFTWYDNFHSTNNNETGVYNNKKKKIKIISIWQY